MRFGMGYGAWTDGPFGGGGRHGRPGRGEHEGGRGRRRVFDGGELKLVLLKLIADAPRHGYDLIREIEGLSGGSYAPSPGVVYPTLTLLDEMGLIEEHRSEGTKKRFAATEAGRGHLAEAAAQVDELFARLRKLADHRERTDGAPIRRAMGNLRQVLQHRLMRDDVSEDTLHEVAALIDEAARKIERMK
ncbi:PadR family transcriptional regulator [Sphingomonas sp. NY01]|uniref:PadR family transcriptional regulator n=1 Tax=Sphingomonas sp. NY01 TaxID=2968057 RepID=UPI00315D0EDD